MNVITCKKDFKSFKVYINNSLHLEILRKSYDGMQSWLEGSDNQLYFIEFYRKEDTSILCEYHDEKIWKDILNLIDNNL